MLTVMMMTGYHAESGEWAWDAGLPAKTGVGSGFVAVMPDKMTVAVFAQRERRR